MSNKEKALVETIKRLEDYDDAAAALTELKQENSNMAIEIAAALLEREKGDIYLQASAFEIVYSIDQKRAFSLSEKNRQQSISLYWAPCLNVLPKTRF